MNGCLKATQNPTIITILRMKLNQQIKESSKLITKNITSITIGSLSMEEGEEAEEVEEEEEEEPASPIFHENLSQAMRLESTRNRNT